MCYIIYHNILCSTCNIYAADVIKICANRLQKVELCNEFSNLSLNEHVYIYDDEPINLSFICTLCLNTAISGAPVEIDSAKNSDGVYHDTCITEDMLMDAQESTVDVCDYLIKTIDDNKSIFHETGICGYNNNKGETVVSICYFEDDTESVITNITYPSNRNL